MLLFLNFLMKNLSNFLFLLLISHSIFSQQKISGRVLDEKKQAVSFANILILNPKDSSFVKGNVADVDGNFTVPQVNSNAYFLQVTALGYQKYYRKIQVSDKDLFLNEIVLSTDNQVLKEVEVNARQIGRASCRERV